MCYPLGEDTGKHDGEQQRRRNRTVADKPRPMEVQRQARAQLAELTGVSPESVSLFEQTDDGWRLEIEVLELSRIPDTMSLLASYEVTLDSQGELTGYRRIRRYVRGRADQGGPVGPRPA
ncbi:gas vesicle protein [Streptomyces sp. NPDC052236]|uniref:gas vesicle protein n=1 Tax=Streptomyces sp. NPDC052236 TaxID=3365686 RepID=UPI0037D86818